MLVLDGPLALDVSREFVRKVASSTPLIFTSTAGGSGPWIPFELAALSEEDTIALFVDAAHMAQVSAVVRADIQGVCNALDGLPLSAMLAGRHVYASEITPGEFLGTLTSAGLQVQALGLQAIFHQLPEAMQGLLLTMGATFTGQASTALLEYLQLLPSETVVRVMDMLGGRGLVQRIPCHSPLHCFKLHEVVRQFMIDWLHDTQRLAATRERVYEAVLAYVEQNSQGSMEARHNLIAEMPNILGLAQVASEQGDVVALQCLITALEAAFARSGAYGYELAQLNRLAEDALPVEPVLDEFPPLDAAAEPVEVIDADLAHEPSDDLIDDAPPLDVVAREVAPAQPPRLPLELGRSGVAEAEKSNVTHVLADLLKASTSARQAGNRRELAAAMVMLGQTWLEKDQVAQAEAAFFEALGIFEAEEDTGGLLLALEGLAGLAFSNQNLAQVVVYATRAENLAAQLGESARQGHLLALLGDTRFMLTEEAEAVLTYGRAIDALAMSDDVLSLGVVQTKLGSVYLAGRDFESAITILTEALTVFEEAERADYQGRVLGSLGTAYGSLGQWVDAQSCHERALTIACQLEDAEEQERQLANLAYVAQAQGNRAMMLEAYRAALDLAFQAEVEEWQVRYLDVLGRMLMDDISQLGVAVLCFEKAEALAPDDARTRLLHRARTRYDRTQNTDADQPPLPGSVEEWVAGASLLSA
ncbi:tetratricopeptide repeat protein [Chloroflexota bacterium]